METIKIIDIAGKFIDLKKHQWSYFRSGVFLNFCLSSLSDYLRFSR